jgi:sulfite reductase beta subunit-like hemoprotein
LAFEGEIMSALDVAEDYELQVADLAPEVRAEILRFVKEIENLDRGLADPDDFKRFRLENGVYGIRGAPDRHMIRIKVRFGEISPDQLDTIASIADDFTPLRQVHLTTRQDVQLHNVRRSDLPAALIAMARAGMTTREACGNTVRNVTACPFAGVSPTEVFDVTPYADAVSMYFLRNPLNQSLPRKLKFAFEGCAEDHARTPIHDIGAVAAVRENNGRLERGFRIYVAGGLGAQPVSAQLLEEFTPADLLIPTCEAIVRTFDRNGERRPEHLYRMRARLKFLAREWGIEKLRAAILLERRAILATRSGLVDFHIEPVEERAPDFEVFGTPLGWSPSLHYKHWERTNVVAQRQPGYSTVLVRCPLGDMTSTDLRAVAGVARRWCAGRIRTTISQNLVLRWVPNEALPWVYRDLAEAGLAHSDAHSIADITRCPGADTCQLALTHSRGLAEALGGVLETDFSAVPEIQNLSMKISGCMNSCGQHHIADIGFYGASSEGEGVALPQYIVMVGGHTEEGKAHFGKPVARVPARRAPEAARRLLSLFQNEHVGDESFSEFINRTSVTRARSLLSDLTVVPTIEQQPEIYRDLGAEDQVFTAEVGAGECAS